MRVKPERGSRRPETRGCGAGRALRGRPSDRLEVRDPKPWEPRCFADWSRQPEGPAGSKSRSQKRRDALSADSGLLSVRRAACRASSRSCRTFADTAGAANRCREGLLSTAVASIRMVSLLFAVWLTMRMGRQDTLGRGQPPGLGTGRSLTAATKDFRHTAALHARSHTA